MIAKVFLFLTVVAAAHATLIGSGIVSPGLWNAGLLGQGLALKGAPLATAVNTASVVSIPGAVSTDRRIIGTAGLLGAPLANGLHANGLLANGLLANGLHANGLHANGLLANGLLANGLVANGLWGAAPLAWGNGLVSPIGLKGAGLLAAPGVVKTVL